MAVPHTYLNAFSEPVILFVRLSIRLTWVRRTECQRDSCSCCWDRPEHWQTSLG